MSQRCMRQAIGRHWDEGGKQWAPEASAEGWRASARYRNQPCCGSLTYAGWSQHTPEPARHHFAVAGFLLISGT